jgi:two-component system, NarL family, response regulator YdfI
MRVAIAAASPVARAGLETLIASSPGMEGAGSFPDLRGVEALRPDVVLVFYDLDPLPPPEGEMPPIVLLAVEAQPVFTRERFQVGVRALLSRDASATEILAAVEAVAAGLAVIEPRDLEALLAASRASGGAPLAAATENGKLTAREIEVLRMMADGSANKTIAWKLGISEHTVKFHVASVLGKLHAATRTEAVTIGIRKGLVLV